MKINYSQTKKFWIFYLFACYKISCYRKMHEDTFLNNMDE